MELNRDQLAVIRQTLESQWFEQQNRKAVVEAEILGKEALHATLDSPDRPSLRFAKGNPRRVTESQRVDLERRLEQLYWERESMTAVISGLEKRMSELPEPTETEEPEEPATEEPAEGTEEEGEEEESEGDA